MSMGKTSIPCRGDTRDRLDELRNGEYKNWDAFLNHMADVWEQRGQDTGEDFEGLQSLEASVRTVEERTGRIEQTLEDMGARR